MTGLIRWQNVALDVHAVSAPCVRRAKDAIERQVDTVSGHVADAVQEGLTLQRYFLPEEFGEDVVRRTLSALRPPDDAGTKP